jgi:hypothetical protein
MPHRLVRRMNGKLLVAAIVGSFLALFVTFTIVYINGRNKIDQNTKATLALCALRVDLQQRVDQTEDFLAQEPGALPFPGVTRAVLLQNLRNQEVTLQALDILDC